MKAQGFLAEDQVEVAAIADAGKQPHDRQMALALAAKAERLIAAKGKKFVELDLKAKPSAAEIEVLIIGPTGKLRAPTFMRGKTMVVGFTPEAYAKVLGSSR